MRTEQEIRDKIEQLFNKRNELPRFDKTPEEEEIFYKYTRLITALQWVIFNDQDWYV